MNKYEYAVEYETNGEKPDLPDDVMVEFFGSLSKIWKPADEVGVWDWGFCIKFRIADERYKPKADDYSWHERGELPPVGSTVRFNKNHTHIAKGSPVGLWGHGDELEVLAHKEGEMSQVAVVWNSAHQQARGIIAECLQPLQTDRDKLVHSLSREVLRYYNDCLGVDCDIPEKAFAGFLVDHGYRKVKQQTEDEFNNAVGSKSNREAYRAGCRFIERGDL